VERSQLEEGEKLVSDREFREVKKRLVWWGMTTMVG